jgi:VWFA-related protein
MRVWLKAGVVFVFTLHAQVIIERRSQPAGKEQPPKQPTLRVDTNLVLIPVTVTDPLNRPVTGLEKDNFGILDGKVPQTITQFAMEDDPVAVGFVFDTSGSVGQSLHASRRAAMEFFLNRDIQDEFFIVEFASSAKLVVPLTQEIGGIAEELLLSRSGGTTAFLDAVYLALNEIKKAKNTKRALVIISDGGDNHSRYTETELKTVLQESDALIYSIWVPGYQTPGGREVYDGTQLMSKIAEQTGGCLFPASAAEFRDIAQKIIIDLRNRYVVGYTPHNQSRDGRYHRVQVQLVPPRGLPPLRAHWRHGYYAPSE